MVFLLLLVIIERRKHIKRSKNMVLVQVIIQIFPKKALTRDSFIHWSFSHTIIYTFNFSLLSYPTELCKVLHIYDDICLKWKKAFISFFPFPICSHYVISLVDDWLSGWLIGWLGSCFPIRLWLCDWLTDCFSDFFSRWPTDWFSGGLCHHLLSLTSKDWGFRYCQRSHGKTKSDTSCISLCLGNFLPFGSLSPSWVP